MSYPPNSAAIIRRSPQHGIHVAGDPITASYSLSLSSPSPSSSSPSSHSRSFISANSRTVICAEPHCNNRIDVVPYGLNTGLAGMNSTVYIKARCKDCEPPITVPTWWEGHAKPEKEEGQWEEASSEDWADEF